MGAVCSHQLVIQASRATVVRDVYSISPVQTRILYITNEYHQVCLDSQKKWRERHPGCQRDCRERHPEYAERNRRAQRARDRKRRLADLVKNSLALELKPCPGEVWLAGDDLGDLARNNLAFSQVLVLQTVGRAARASP